MRFASLHGQSSKSLSISKGKR